MCSTSMSFTTSMMMTFIVDREREREREGERGRERERKRERETGGEEEGSVKKIEIHNRRQVNSPVCDYNRRRTPKSVKKGRRKGEG